MTRGHPARWIVPALLAAALCAPPAAAQIEGRWRLVEQGRGSGRIASQALEPPPALECSVEGPAASCRIWTAEDPPRAFEWPAFLSESGPLPVRVVERVVDPRGGRLHARYRVDLPPDGARSLEVVEEYRLTRRGSLSGAVRVTLIEADGSRGGWVLRRRFEREP